MNNQINLCHIEDKIINTCNTIKRILDLINQVIQEELRRLYNIFLYHFNQKEHLSQKYEEKLKYRNIVNMNNAKGIHPWNQLNL